MTNSFLITKMTSDQCTSAFFASLSQKSEFSNVNLDQNLINICDDVENNFSEDTYDNSNLFNSSFDEEFYNECENVERSERTLDKEDVPDWGTSSQDEALFDICIKAEEAAGIRQIETGVKRLLAHGPESPAKYRAEQLSTPLRFRNPPKPVQETVENESHEMTMDSRHYKSYPGVRNLLKFVWLKKVMKTSTTSIEKTLSSFSKECLREYDFYLKKWYLYCTRSNIDYHEAPVDEVICFLKKMFYDGTKFDALCTCRSALALLDHKNLCKEEKVQRIFRDIYRLRNSRNNVTLNTSTVLNFIAIFYPYDNMSMDILSKKLVTLLALGTAHSIRAIQKMSVADIRILPNKIMIKVQNQMSSKACEEPVLVLPYFDEKPEICLGRALVAYLERTECVRGEEKQLFISLIRPYKVVSAQTLSRWVKEVIARSGVDASLL